MTLCLTSSGALTTTGRPGCGRALAAESLRYSPDSDGDGQGNRPRSPEYRPVSSLWADASSAHPARSQDDEIVFGPGVQLEGTSKRPEYLVADHVTRMDIDGVAQATSLGRGSGDVSDVEDPGVQGVVRLWRRRQRRRPWRAKMHGDDYAAFNAGMFKAIPASILQRPDQPALPRSAAAARGILRRPAVGGPGIPGPGC